MKQLLRTVVLLLVRILGTPGAFAATRQARTGVKQTPRILLIRPDHLGDLDHYNTCVASIENTRTGCSYHDDGRAMVKRSGRTSSSY